MFAKPLMLLFMVAAVAPLLIHLWNRRRHEVVDWAAMTFLMAALRRRSKRLLLENWLLLLIRTAAIVCLCFAVAEPVRRLFSDEPVAAGGATHHVLVLDGSYSMLAQQGDQTAFQLAQQAARNIVQRGGMGDAYSVLLMADQPKWVVAEPTFAKDDVLDEIANLAPEHAGANLSLALRGLERPIRRARERLVGLENTHVYFFTDMGQNTWESANGDDEKSLLRRLKNNQVDLSVRHIEMPNADNRIVEQLRCRQAMPMAGEPIDILATVSNASNRDAPVVRLDLVVNGRVVDQTNESVPARGSVQVRWQHLFEFPGEHVVEVRSSNDVLEVDNHRRLSVPVQSAIRVLIVEGDVNAGRFLAFALQPNPSDSFVEITRATDNALLELDLQTFDAVALCNVNAISSSEAQLLEDFVTQGGGLLIGVGEQVDFDAWNQTLEALLPAELKRISPEGDYAIDPLGHEHSIVEPFRGNEQAGLLSTPIWRYVETTPHPTTKVVAAVSTGDGLILERRVGDGRVLLVNTALHDTTSRATSGDPAWNALPGWPSFLPLAQGMLAELVASRVAQRNVLVHQPISGRVAEASSGWPAELEFPDGSSERVALEVRGQFGYWSHPGAALSGTARFQIPDIPGKDQVYAINLDPAEGRLIAMDPNQLPVQFRSGDNAPAPEGDTVTHPSYSAFRYFLFAALVLLLLENGIASWSRGR